MTVMLILKVVVNLFLKYYLPLKKSDLLSLNVTNFKIHILSKKNTSHYNSILGDNGGKLNIMPIYRYRFS